MSLQTVRVTLEGLTPANTPFFGVAGFRLNNPYFVDGVMIADTGWIDVTFDVAGQAYADLIPNEVLEPDSFYFYKVSAYNGKKNHIVMSGQVYVPNHNCKLVDLIANPRTTPTPDFSVQGYLSQAKQEFNKFKQMKVTAVKGDDAAVVWDEETNTMNFTLPKGDKGDKGDPGVAPAASIADIVAAINTLRLRVHELEEIIHSLTRINI